MTTDVNDEVIHEKEGRRHAHCVWSRINMEEIKAVNFTRAEWRQAQCTGPNPQTIKEALRDSWMISVCLTK